MSSPLNLTNQRFGRLLVIARVGSNKDGRSLWKCQCSCGAEKIIVGKSLCRGLSNSCGCQHVELARRQNLAGWRFSRWLVLSRQKSDSERNATWRCRCDCGKEKTISARTLTRGDSTSCGCLRAERNKASVGSKNPNWRGGITPINAGIRASKEYEKWRCGVLTRDHYSCQECGEGGYLHAHHIKPFAAFPELRLEISNGQTLCVPCHKKTQSWGGQKKCS